MRKTISVLTAPLLALALATAFVACHDTPSTWGHHSWEPTYTPGGSSTSNSSGTGTNTPTPASGGTASTPTGTPASAPAATPVAVTGVSLNKTSASLSVGGTDTLVATVSPANATDPAVTWTSSDTSVATVANGVVTAVAAGSATITASAGGETASCTVTVLVPMTMKTGSGVNAALMALGADAGPDKTFAASPSAPPAGAVTQTLSSSGSYPVVAWLDGTVIKFYAQGYTDSNVKIPLEANSSEMFKGCSHLTSIDLSGFDTGNVTDMSNMFMYCSGLTSLNVSGLNTGNVTNMSRMFWGCSGLTSLDVSGWDTGNVTDMSFMFGLCSGLTTIYASSSFVTTAVTSSTNMFTDCNNLVGGAGTVFSSSPQPTPA
ncbi:MAG: BspA family leucine-rich repeat surface protein [Treponema sp.]|nr:BspA family leucine-rich repeat surface protein [Treponema sp.]